MDYIHASHDTRYSDSSLYDERCKQCGHTDRIGCDELSKPCPDETEEHKKNRDI